ncbi:MAG: tRNA (5-methylaminomethyl-2-thiouridine)(34)-methyltransferase MnmD [Rhodocyclaceae bacterium]|nr:tRNA (5-methylaminomethyl-2-thiouridine)(34)-methyltransferase MnmD [Rhodocyclaceae bacterium]
MVQQDDGSLLAPDFGDTYASRAGALDQSRAVFLAGCGLPERLTGRQHTVLETGFGTGLNALALAQAAHGSHAAPPARGCSRSAQSEVAGAAYAAGLAASGCHVHYVGIEAHPLSRDDLAAALAAYDELSPWREALLAGWPPPMEGTYRWALGPRFTLTLVLGEVLPALRELDASADSVFLDGFAPDRNPAMWTTELLAEVVAHCRPSARIASWCVAGDVRRALAAVGCAVERKPGFAAKRERLEAVVDERVPLPRQSEANERSRDGSRDGFVVEAVGKSPDSTLVGREAVQAGPVDGADSIPDRALVIGAGIAGASVAAALALRGIAVTVLEAERLAAGASGNPLGVVRPEPSGLDHPISRLTAMGTLWLRGWLEGRWRARSLGTGAEAQPPTVHADRCGAIRLPRDDKHARRLREHAEASPPEWMQWLGAAEASDRVGAPVAGDGVWIAEGWNVRPPDLVAALLAASGAAVLAGRVRSIAPADVPTGSRLVSSNHACVTPGGDSRPADGTYVPVTTDAVPEPGGLGPSGSGGRPAWRVTLGDGTTTEWPLIVIANAFGVSGHIALPLRHVRGQLSWTEGGDGEVLQAIVCREGYVTPAVDGRNIVGATFQRDDADLAPRDEDDRTNQWRLSRLLPGWADRPLGPARVSVRAATPDRLPLVGALAPGLYASLGHGSRGLTCAPLCGELIASMVCAEPLPLPRDLVRRLDPLRFGEIQPKQIQAQPTNVRESDD